MESYERIKHLREENGYSVLEIARLLNSTPRQVRKWESGEVKMRFRHYIRLAQFYNVSLDYIAGFTNERLTQ
ncbi:MAG: helix-turn-helix transcriptional regulator [Clostridia bacterium]|nr:helix-turn-helix transcriptional regulator [Clostridia bacterium]